MKIILLKNFKKKFLGDIVNLKKGFVRNFLFTNLNAIFYKKEYNLYFIKKYLFIFNKKSKNYLNFLFLKLNNKFFFFNNLFFEKDFLNDLIKDEIFSLFKKKNIIFKKKNIYLYRDDFNFNFINIAVYLYNYIFINIFICLI